MNESINDEGVYRAAPGLAGSAKYIMCNVVNDGWTVNINKEGWQSIKVGLQSLSQVEGGHEGCQEERMLR